MVNKYSPIMSNIHAWILPEATSVKCTYRSVRQQIHGLPTWLGILRAKSVPAVQWLRSPRGVLRNLSGTSVRKYTGCAAETRIRRKISNIGFFFVYIVDAMCWRNGKCLSLMTCSFQGLPQISIAI